MNKEEKILREYIKRQILSESTINITNRKIDTVGYSSMPNGPDLNKEEKGALETVAEFIRKEHYARGGSLNFGGRGNWYEAEWARDKYFITLIKEESGKYIFEISIGASDPTYGTLKVDSGQRELNKSNIRDLTDPLLSFFEDITLKTPSL